jgi:FeS assembly SUF system protein
MAEHPLQIRIIDVLRTIFDPEIPVNIHDLGLIYGIDIDDDGKVVVRMTLTSPNCPMAGVIVMQVDEKLKKIEGVSSARVELVWDPPWTPDKMTEAAKLDAGLHGLDQPSDNKLRVLGGGANKWKP